ncbi:hypothetical protein [Nonlabens ponticola]|uniref:Uncharacterized protein n=1 Tax=Nonlabens ponticola TaxID=2496866 RepID=A0A3S9MY46_9FLAO|nr:hypothetical protein [Nonlabens ponticola]AZQ43973.1 hypothetical protein EJ995_06900 [Nonlabens ponticola]
MARLVVHKECRLGFKGKKDLKKKFRTSTVIMWLFVILSTISCESEKNESKKYHEISFTASNIILEKWNVDSIDSISYVQETIDEKGRVTELRFYNYKHELDWAGSGFYGGPIIRYDYTDQKIIETFFSAENEIANDFQTSEVPYRHVYQLNSDNQIIDIKQYYKIDFEWTDQSFEETIDHLKFYKPYKEDGSELKSVFGYNYSHSKMGGIDPRVN